VRAAAVRRAARRAVARVTAQGAAGKRTLPVISSPIVQNQILSRVNHGSFDLKFLG